MGIFQEYPDCRRKQFLKNKRCVSCELNLDAAKKIEEGEILDLLPFAGRNTKERIW
jgi:hypothetical protein